MAKIKKTKLTEHFKSLGLSEGFLAKFFAKLKKSGKEEEYEKLTKDPSYQAILKKYDIKPVNW